MPNLQQIIALRKKYISQRCNDSFSLEANELGEYLEFQEIKKAFSSGKIGPINENIKQKYFSISTNQQTPDIIKYFEKQKEEEVVLLFIDIAHFSSKTSGYTAKEITSWLDDYYRILIPIIYDKGGEIEKIMGDGIICIFGKPFLNPQIENEEFIKAEDCARIIINKFKDTLSEVKIALHNGPVIYYKTPTEDYEEYTMIGNTLTELYRLESVSKSNSINYFMDCGYDLLTKQKQLGININNEHRWEYNYKNCALQGIGRKTVRILTRI